MYCSRFNLQVEITKHAQKRMVERNIDEQSLIFLLENGKTRYKDETRLWIAHFFPDRADNLLCAAVSLENCLVVKTVMYHFRWED